MENISDFLVNNPKQILLHFKTLALEKCIISASFGENNSFLTAILDVNEKKQFIIIDCGPKEYLNKELLKLGIVNCKTNFGGIEVLFAGREIKRAGKSGETALSIKIPEAIYWIQRRKLYRVRSPLSKDSYCSITFAETEDEKQESVDFKLFDLSASGFALLCETEDLAKKLTINSEFNQCKLVLDNKETHTISFLVQSKNAFNPNKPTKNQRIGCEFVNLPAKSESAFLCYMQDIERQMKKNFS